jgi:hypothetical protein
VKTNIYISLCSYWISKEIPAQVFPQRWHLVKGAGRNRKRQRKRGSGGKTRDGPERERRGNCKPGSPPSHSWAMLGSLPTGTWTESRVDVLNVILLFLTWPNGSLNICWDGNEDWGWGAVGADMDKELNLHNWVVHCRMVLTANTWLTFFPYKTNSKNQLSSKWPTLNLRIHHYLEPTALHSSTG